MVQRSEIASGETDLSGFSMSADTKLSWLRRRGQSLPLRACAARPNLAVSRVRSCVTVTATAEPRQTCRHQPSTVLRDAATTDQTAINIAAMTGPITKPLRPNTAIPPSVEISTT